MRILFVFLFLTTAIFGFEFDKKVQKDNSSFWGAHYDVPKYYTIGVLGLSLYEGTESRLGRTSWNALEAGLLSQVIAEGVKRVSGRLRPGDTDNPNDWGEGGASFFSGHVSGMTALVTPYIFEYQKDSAYAHLLWLLPAYQMVGRVKAQAHWQSDVLIGAIAGGLCGYLTWKISTPLIFSFAKDNAYVGLKYRF